MLLIYSKLLYEFLLEHIGANVLCTVLCIIFFCCYVWARFFLACTCCWTSLLCADTIYLCNAVHCISAMLGNDFRQYGSVFCYGNFCGEGVVFEAGEWILHYYIAATGVARMCNSRLSQIHKSFYYFVFKSSYFCLLVSLLVLSRFLP